MSDEQDELIVDADADADAVGGPAFVEEVHYPASHPMAPPPTYGLTLSAG